jgi:allantoicase
MKVAILQRTEQNQAWEDQSASLDSEQVSEWSKDVERWESDPSEQNPFESRSTRVLKHLRINIFN